MLDTKEIEFYDVYHLPIIKAYADKIDLVNTINRLVPTKMEIDPGTLLLAMVMDALSGRHPLYCWISSTRATRLISTQRLP